uniref:THAP-type domain-containing protein n=1 Tax=Heterorhabditis bacteriophora TaxID=37862 RepID=A0A1I7WLR4_HETBA
MEKSNKLDKWVPHELNGYRKNCRYEICSDPLFRSKSDPFLDHIVTSDEKWIPYDKRRRAPKESYGHCLVVGKWNYPLQLLGSWQNHHSEEVLLRNRQNAPRTATFMSNTDQSKETNPLP